MKSTSTCTPRPNTWIPVWRPFSLSLLRHNQSPQWLLPPARIFARTALSLPRPLGITYDKHHYDRKGVLLPAKPLFSEMKQRWQSSPLLHGSSKSATCVSNITSPIHFKYWQPHLQKLSGRALDPGREFLGSKAALGHLGPPLHFSPPPVSHVP